MEETWTKKDTIPGRLRSCNDMYRPTSRNSFEMHRTGHPTENFTAKMADCTHYMELIKWQIWNWFGELTIEWERTKAFTEHKTIQRTRSVMTFITIYSLDKNASSKRQMVASNLVGEYPFLCFNLFWHVDDNLQLVTFCDTLQSASTIPSIRPFLVHFVDTGERHVRMIFVLLLRL